MRRHVDLVYSTALRQVGGDAFLAQDVAQSVFSDLARKAGSLSGCRSLSGWLYTSTRFAAAKAVRSEQRRQGREERFMAEPPVEASTEAEWEAIRPALDDAMGALKEQDREAVILRYFQERPFGDIGQRLGVNENTARMRVERALEKLRASLARRGITTTAALSAAITTHAVQTAPGGLAAMLAAGSMSGAGGGSIFFWTLMTAKMKLGLGALVLAGVTATIIIQSHQQAKLRTENETLRRKVAEATADVLPAPPPAGQKLPEDQFRELLRLRNEVGLLRRGSNELAAMLAGAKVQSTRTAAVLQTQAQPDEPRTPDAATRSIFETMARGDWESFFQKFAEPGMAREQFEQVFDPRVRSSLEGMEVLMVGEPTNSFRSNMWFVPYKVRFKDGNEKEFRLHVALDTRTQRWILKGGL